jgi:cytochrome c553
MFSRKYFLILVSTFVIADESMQQLYMKNGCSGCHGIYAEGIGVTPRLQGRKKEVLITRLKDLKKGKTRSAFGTIMVSFAKSLTDEQIEKMAAYLSTLKKTTPKERYELEPDEDDGSS